MRHAIVLFLFLGFTGCASSPEKAEPKIVKTVVRAAFDVGSGATKMKVGRVLTDDKGMTDVEILFPTAEDNGEVKVAYQDALKASGKKKEFSPEIIETGVTELKKLKASAEQLGATEFVGVATSAFREAKNGEAVAGKLSGETGIAIKVISQNEEAELGFWAAVGISKVDPLKAVVWDIGGGSQQLSMMSKEGQVVSSNNSFGSDILKEKVRQLKGGGKKRVNPVGKSVATKALAAVHKEARKGTADVKNRVTKEEGVVVGIGSVHFISVKDQAMGPEDKSYDQGMVKKALEASWNLTDDKISGKYAENQIPNLILVLGFMEEVGITEVAPLKVNLADGLLRKGTAKDEPKP